MMKQFLAIEIGGTKLQLFVGDEQSNILQRWRFDVEPRLGGAGIRAQIETALPDILRAHNVAAIGVGYGGPVDWRTGQICCSHQIEGWADFPLADWIGDLVPNSGAYAPKFGKRARPVVVDNDANCGALGEALRGAGRGSNPVFYVTLGSGVGGGLVADGKIFHGAKPGESEIGHVRLDRTGTIVEQRCSGWAVDKMVHAMAEQNPSSKLARLTAGMDAGQARALAPALQENCPLAQKILAEIAGNLAFGLSHVTHLMHPQVIILGGGLSLLGERLRAAVDAALQGFIMEAFGRGPGIALATLQEDAVPVGALLLARSAASPR
jgi:glucokinase